MAAANDGRLGYATRLAWSLLAVGIGAGALCLIGGIGQARELERAYLAAVTYVFGLSAGALSLLMVGHLVRGAWAEVTRRILEAAAWLLPVSLVLFVPVFWDLSTIYPWADPAAVDQMEPRFAAKVEDKDGYLSPLFFWIRAVAIFAILTALAALLTYGSRRHDATGDPRLLVRMRGLAGPGLFIYAVVLTFAATDWWKSIDPAWYSTMYPVLYLVGFAVAAYALALVVLVALRRAGRAPAAALAPKRWGQLGTLLLALIMLWLYVNFGQYLITWSGDLPDKIQWLVPRARTSWQWVAAALVLLHFAAPFLLLLPAANRRSPRLLAAVAAGVLALRAVDQHWLLAPSFEPAGAYVHWLDVAALVAVGGVWSALFLWRLTSAPLSPRAREVLEAEP